MRAEGVQRGVQSGRVHYVVLCVRLRQNRVISSTQGSRVAVLWQHASVAGSVMVPGNGNGLGTDDTEFAVTPAVCPTASWRGGARVEASTNPAVAVAVAARRRTKAAAAAAAAAVRPCPRRAGSGRVRAQPGPSRAGLRFPGAGAHARHHHHADRHLRAGRAQPAGPARHGDRRRGARGSGMLPLYHPIARCPCTTQSRAAPVPRNRVLPLYHPRNTSPLALAASPLAEGGHARASRRRAAKRAKCKWPCLLPVVRVRLRQN